MNCPKCGRSYSDDLLYCLDDGTRLVRGRDVSQDQTLADHPRIVIDPVAATDLEYCPACGTGNASDSRFCKKCGQPLAQVNPVPVDPAPVSPTVLQPQPRRRSYAGIIAVIFALIALLLLVIVIAVLAYSWNGTTVVNVNTETKTPTPSPTPKTPTPSPTPDQTNINAQTVSRIGKTGTLTTDTNLRAGPRPDSDKVGTQYKGARVKILEVAEVPNDEGGTSVWYHVKVTSYGVSIDSNNAGLEKDPDSADEGWINSNPKVYDQSKHTQVHKKTVDFGDNK
ncbi:MAG: double zinc ribbon domain-containing protein [Pyrinomonadaceae bacterium]